MHHPTDRIAHTTAFVTPVMEHWLEQEIAQWVDHEGSIRQAERIPVVVVVVVNSSSSSSSSSSSLYDTS